ncbi:MAG: threonine ammonia-lyase [Nitriliruptorales bacterium]|nr:threonine ammonia-lyase [Nitriliruptorales bacterium]
MSLALITLDDVLAAAKRLEGVAQSTPLERSRAISRVAGVETHLKCEHLQRTGSFKIRGAYNRIAQLGEDERARGVVCSSAGNHAQGVALSASLAGVRSTVFMPETAPLPKVEATRAYGAAVMLEGHSYDDAFDAAQRWMAEHDAVFVHPYDHADVIAGQGTVGLEILDQLPDVRAVLVPVGGGGLISGVATAIKARRPDVRMIGVQAAGAAAFPASIDAGEPIMLDRVSTMADGIAVKRPGTLTLAHVRARVDHLVTVSDEAIARAVLLLVERAKQVVEPSGAAGLAALLDPETSGLAALEGPLCVLLCGGNVDPLLLGRIISSGMYEEGRYLIVRTRLVDEPGALQRFLTLPAQTGANIVGVRHNRLGTLLGVLEVEVELELETRGPEHIATLLSELRASGYPVS